MNEIRKSGLLGGISADEIEAVGKAAADFVRHIRSHEHDQEPTADGKVSYRRGGGAVWKISTLRKD